MTKLCDFQFELKAIVEKFKGAELTESVAKLLQGELQDCIDSFGLGSVMTARIDAGAKVDELVLTVTNSNSTSVLNVGART